MIFLFSGEDNYESYLRSNKKITEVASLLNANVQILNLDEITDVNVVIQLIEGIDIFNSVNILLGKRLFNNKKILEYFTVNYEKLKKYEIVLWQDNKVDSKLKLYKMLLLDKCIFNFDLPREGEFKNWLLKESIKLNINLSSLQLQFLLEKVGINKLSILNELNKIDLYLNNKDKNTLTIEELNGILGYNIKGDMWKFLDSVGLRNKKQAIIEFRKLVTYENNTQLLISMLGRELRMISQVKVCQIEGKEFKELKFIPFILKKTIEKSKKFDFKELVKYTKNLFELDYSIKKGEVEEVLALTLFISSL